MISFIMVNYNTKDITQKTICDIRNSIVSEEFEIILVDNNSTDGSKEYFSDEMSKVKNFTYIYSDKNGGICYGNNLGAKYARGDILVIINPDIEIPKKGIDLFVKENLVDGVGILAPKIIYPDGTIQPNCGKFSTFSTYFLQSMNIGYYIRKFKIIDTLNIISNKFNLNKNGLIGQYLNNFDKCVKEENDCDWVSGACLAIRKKLFDKIHGYDENFFMYVDDLELCKRVKDLNYRVVINRNFEIIHLEGASQDKQSILLSRVDKEKFKSRIYNFYKHKGVFSAFILKYFFVFTLIIKAIIFLVKLSFKSFKDRIYFAYELTKYEISASGMGVVGYYGSGNKGDEIILHSLIESQQGKFKNIFVLTNNISETSQLHEVKARNKKSLFDNLYVLFSTNELIIGGGGLFLKNNTTTYIYMLTLATLFKLFGKKVSIDGIGLDYGALDSRIHRYLFLKLIKLAEFIKVRDEFSYDYIIKSYSHKELKNLFLRNDFVFDYLDIWKQENPTLAKEKILGVSLMNLEYDYSNIEEFIRQYIEKEYLIKFYLFFKNENDDIIVHELIDKLEYSNIEIFDVVLSKNEDFNSLFFDMSKNEAFLSMRFHPMLISYKLGSNVYVVSHNSKISNFAKKYKLEIIK